MSEAREKRLGFRVVFDFLKRVLSRKPAAPGGSLCLCDGSGTARAEGAEWAAVAEIEEDSFRSFLPRR
jgi:hypothetical protein